MPPLDSLQNEQAVRFYADSLKNRKNEFGESHPYSLEAEIMLALAMEKKNQDGGTAAALAAMNQWVKLAGQMKAKAGSDQPIDDNNTNELMGYKFAEPINRRSICRWLSDSGLILSYILSSEHLTKEALLIAGSVYDVDTSTDDDHPGERVRQLLNLSQFFRISNEFAKARSSILSAEQSASKEEDPHEKERLLAMCDLEESSLSFEQQDFVRSIDFAGDARDKLVKTGDNESELMSDALELAAKSLAMFPEKVDEALADEDQSWTMRKKLYGTNDIRCQNACIQMVRLLRLRDKYKKQKHISLAAYGKAVELGNDLNSVIKGHFTDCKDQEHAMLFADSCLEYGYCARDNANYRGRMDDARHLFAGASDIYQMLPDPASARRRVEALDALAGIDVLSGELPLARTRILQASEILENYATDTLPQLSLAEQLAFNHTIEEHMNSLLAVCRDQMSVVDPKILSAQRSLAGLNPLFDPYKELLRWKGFLLEQLRLRSQATTLSNDAAVRNLVASHHKITEQILASYMNPGDSKQHLQELEDKKEELERRINDSTRVKFRELAGLNIDPAMMQLKLGNDEALVDLYEFVPYTDSQSHYAAVVSTPDSLRWIDLGQAATIDQALSSWRDELRKDLPGVRSVWFGAKPAVSQEGGEKQETSWMQLQRLLCSPLQKVLPASTKHVWISDASELSRLPWSVLFSGAEGMKNMEVCQVDSPRELLRLKDQESLRSRIVRAASAPAQMLIVGGVDFGTRAPSLPGTITELKLIQAEAESFHLKPVILSDLVSDASEKPTRKNVIDQLSKCEFAHLATHGYFRDVPSDTARNPLIDSGLLVSNAGSTDKLDKGFMTAEDLLTADLSKCKLVTLSACETGRGRELNGQGVIGLRSSLMGAGARTILLSLWKVPDRATNELMQAFYQKMFEGQPPAVALREAQRSVRYKEKKWQAPLYWAAWVLIGNGWQK